MPTHHCRRIIFDTLSLEAGHKLAHYEILEPIGKGGMGEVYRAKDSKLGRDVAIKVLPEEFAENEERLARFKREAKLLASLNHPNIATIHGIEESDGVKALVLELVEGPTLAERIAEGPISVEEALPMARQIAEALEAGHEAGVIHRDLKPANVKVKEDGTIKVLDYGLAKALEGETPSGTDSQLSQSPTLTRHGTQVGVILGTAAYMSPEQAKGKKVDKRADVWAFGVVLYEMLTGKRAFAGEDVSDTLAFVLTKEPDWDALPADLSPTLRMFLIRCLEKDPKRRLPDIGVVRLAMDGAFETTGTQPGAVSQLGGWQTVLPWGLAGMATLTVFGLLLMRPSGDTPVLRADVSPPPGTRYHFTALTRGPATLSPNGRRIAFSARDAVGRVQLYVRSLDEPEARVLPGTEGAEEPFWSPDGRWVGFFADQKLKKIEASGGPPQDIGGAPGFGRGGSWNRQDVIVYAHGDGPLLRVAAGGGQPEPVTELDKERGDNDHRYPQFLPGGRHFLYLARNDGGEELNVIMVGSLDGDASKPVLKAPAAATYASGQLLFVRAQTLMAQPFDTKRRELTGEAVPIANDIRMQANAGTAVFSASENGTLLYQTGAREMLLRLEWVDRTGARQGTLGNDADYAVARPSPDGRHVAVATYDANGHPDLWVYELSRQIRTRISFDPARDTNPVWLPDSAALIFPSNRNGQFDLYRKGLVGSSEPELLLESDGNKFPSSVSPDGKLLAYSRSGEGTGQDVWILPLEGEREPYVFIQSRFDERRGMFSPDRKWMAYVSNESGRDEVYVDAFPTPGQKQQLSADGGTSVWWRNDGRELLYQEPNGRVVAVAVDAPDDRLILGAPTPLFEGPPPIASYTAPFPDAQGFLLLKPAEEEIPQPLRLVVNWTAELEK